MVTEISQCLRIRKSYNVLVFSKFDSSSYLRKEKKGGETHFSLPDKYIPMCPPHRDLNEKSSSTYWVPMTGWRRKIQFTTPGIHNKAENLVTYISNDTIFRAVGTTAERHHTITEKLPTLPVLCHVTLATKWGDYFSSSFSRVATVVFTKSALGLGSEGINRIAQGGVGKRYSWGENRLCYFQTQKFINHSICGRDVVPCNLKVKCMERKVVKKEIKNKENRDVFYFLVHVLTS